MTSVAPAAGELAAQVADRHPHRVRERVRVLVPHVLEQALRAVHLVRVEEEPAQQRVLLRVEVDGDGAVAHLLAGSVEHEARATG